MKQVKAFFLALLLAGCASTASSTSMSVEPQKFEMIPIIEAGDSASADSQSLAAGEYLFKVDEQDDSQAARFSIYVSEEQYESMSQDLELDLVCTLGPDEEQLIRLKAGEYVYVAATDNKTGLYNENLNGLLLIQPE